MGVLAIILAACITLVVLFEPIYAVVIPGPDDAHAYKVAVANFPLTNIAHQDPHDPQLNRKLEVSLFLPVKKTDCTGEHVKLYMPPGVAHASDVQFFGNKSTGVFAKMEYKVCSGSRQTIDASKHPIVFLEPQVGTSRFLYSTLARFMSANGMAVALIDHSHESTISLDEAVDGEAPRNDSVGLNPFTELTAWNETVTKTIDTRIEDINAVLQGLSDVSFLQRQFPSLKLNATFDTSSYTVVGHGIGGTTATTLSMLDPRVRFSINLSGSAPLLQHPTSADIYFFGRSDFRRENDIHWSATWKNLGGKATEWDLKDAGLFDFSDLPWVVDLARKDEKMTIKEVKGLHGSLGPFGFHGTACFLEAYLKAELVVPKDFGAIGDCVRMFDQMVPYSGPVKAVI
ncbi:uncharacterized protein EKO05_0006981 [Ascochyta rabiei]|uniref:1-alkyl-2-acetylglycerophosphocholine esterase n=1 Tax=Didymella rabiei TaxID=5454 RepID=A0A162Z4U5_DIDRA|nr:uncharacterized protein EKO05_0006981 [Ascochyta rabiei]KZM20396.1 1-alkyl-2-acetylglycerophosphocholine esterase [Ascochyta rabiei]UPX16590.1 hypothetical protein EKO05_0006981 [Ascochyta rabiei]